MKYKLSKDTSLEDVSGTLVLLRTNGDAAVFDALGGLLLSAMLDDRIDSCINRIAHDYGVEEARVRSDFLEFKERLVSLDLIQRFF